MPTLTTLCAVAFAFVVICVERYLKNSRRQLRSYPLPPGPSGLPWFGMPAINLRAPWLTCGTWAKKYGDLVYFRLLGKDVVVINSENVARDLLEHRSRNYSDRPLFTSGAMEFCGLGFNSALLPYGDRWRLHRRFFHQTFRNDAVSRFRPLQFRKSCRLLQQLLIAPDQFSEHVFDYTASIIMNSAYNYDPASRQDEFLEVVAKVIEVLTATVFPAVAVISGTCPGFFHLPSWFPGMSFRKKMATAKEFACQYVERPFEYSVQKLSHVGYTPSMVHDSIQKAGLSDAVTDKAWMRELKGAAASAFLGGAETSTSVIMTFFLMMVLNPEAQEKAQAQIDLVLGGDRLPTIDDRPSLPYVDAILRELIPSTDQAMEPALPHLVMDDDVYSGFHIPKGAVILTNIWSMTRDESKYPEPDKFIPDRFLSDDGSLLPDDPARLIFGFGRRICPGRHFADTSIWSLVSNILTVFCISKPRDANGAEVPVEPKFSTGVVAHPLPFACSIVPRKPGMDAKKLEQLIAASVVEQ